MAIKPNYRIIFSTIYEPTAFRSLRSLIKTRKNYMYVSLNFVEDFIFYHRVIIHRINEKIKAVK